MWRSPLPGHISIPSNSALDLDRTIERMAVDATGLLDTSVTIDWDDPTVAAALPDAAAVSAITLAELAAGPHLASTGAEGSRRQARLQQVEAAFEPLPFDAQPREASDKSSPPLLRPVAHIGAASRTCSSRQPRTPINSTFTLAIPTTSPASTHSSGSSQSD